MPNRIGADQTANDDPNRYDERTSHRWSAGLALMRRPFNTNDLAHFQGSKSGDTSCSSQTGHGCGDQQRQAELTVGNPLIRSETANENNQDQQEG